MLDDALKMVERPKVKECGQTLEDGKGKEAILPRIRKGSQPSDFSPFWTSDFQNFKITNWKCFKPLNLWQAVKATIKK